MSYIPNTDADREKMLGAIGVQSLDDLFAPIPKPLQFQGELNIPPRMDQMTLAKHLTRLAAKNLHADEAPCFLGAGIYDHYVPPTVAAITGRSEFYTSYTPYQPEMSQGVLQSIFEFQTLLCQLARDGRRECLHVRRRDRAGRSRHHGRGADGPQDDWPSSAPSIPSIVRFWTPTCAT